MEPGRPRERRPASVALALLLLGSLSGGGLADAGEISGDYAKLSGIIIPGFASTQLRAWSVLDCPYSPLDFNPLDLVWLDTTKVSSSHLLGILGFAFLRCGFFEFVVICARFFFVLFCFCCFVFGGVILIPSMLFLFEVERVGYLFKKMGLFKTQNSSF